MTLTERGAGLVALLVGVVIMGVLVVIVLRLESVGSGGHHGNSSVGSLNVSPAAGASNISTAAKAACEADYQSVSTAVNEYLALHGQPPTEMSQIQPMLKDLVIGPKFAITLTSPGKVEVATPQHPASPGSGNCNNA